VAARGRNASVARLLLPLVHSRRKETGRWFISTF
jgi:hypothetical protein